MSAIDRPIRICHIVTRLAVRGVPRHVIELAGGLDRARFSVEILTGHSEPGEGDLIEEARDRGIAVTRIEALRRRVHGRDDARALYQIYRHLRRVPCDIVHTHIAKAGILGRQAARWARVPLVLHTYHGVPEEWVGNSKRARLFRAVERRAARTTDAIIAVSRAVREDIRKLDIGRRRRWEIIYNGIAPEFFALEGAQPASERGLCLVAIGSLTPEKGVDVVLRALPSVARRHPGVELVIVGDGPLRSELEALAQALDVAPCVRFVGLAEDVRPWLRQCALLVAPSRREGMGLAVVEGMAMGCPVVASRVGGLAEVVVDGQTGVLVAVEDSRALADAICKLLDEPAERARLGANGRQRAQAAFARDGALRQVQDLYDALLRERSIR